LSIVVITDSQSGVLAGSVYCSGGGKKRRHAGDSLASEQATRDGDNVGLIDKDRKGSGENVPVGSRPEPQWGVWTPERRLHRTVLNGIPLN